MKTAQPIFHIQLGVCIDENPMTSIDSLLSILFSDRFAVSICEKETWLHFGFYVCTNHSKYSSNLLQGFEGTWSCCLIQPPTPGLSPESGLLHITGCIFRTYRTINEQLIPHRTWHFRVMVVHLKCSNSLLESPEVFI